MFMSKRNFPKHKSDAAQWLADNGHSWGLSPASPGRAPSDLGTKFKRSRRGKNMGDNVGRFDTIKKFVDRSRSAKTSDCIFVPAAQPHVPARVSFCGKTISAARYMCLLTHGTPKYEGAVARHKCGNGHLSCVNPAHLVWGDAGDNQSDATRHRAAGSDIQDRINSVTQ